jgi:hypothetical protein
MALALLIPQALPILDHLAGMSMLDASLHFKNSSYANEAIINPSCSPKAMMEEA